MMSWTYYSDCRTLLRFYLILYTITYFCPLIKFLFTWHSITWYFSGISSINERLAFLLSTKVCKLYMPIKSIFIFLNRNGNWKILQNYLLYRLSGLFSTSLISCLLLKTAIPTWLRAGAAKNTIATECNQIVNNYWLLFWRHHIE